MIVPDKIVFALIASAIFTRFNNPLTTMSKNRTIILLALAGATIAFFAIPKLQASQDWSGHLGTSNGSINLTEYP